MLLALAVWQFERLNSKAGGVSAITTIALALIT